MSNVFCLLQKIEAIRPKIKESEYLDLVETVGEVHKDYYPGIQVVETFPVTPRAVVRLVRAFLNGRSRIQTEVSCYLLNHHPSYHYTIYGFHTFRDWMVGLGFDVFFNRVFDI